VPSPSTAIIATEKPLAVPENELTKYMPDVEVVSVASSVPLPDNSVEGVEELVEEMVQSNSTLAAFAAGTWKAIIAIDVINKKILRIALFPRIPPARFSRNSVDASFRIH
jgi:hypothetical protein